MQRRRGIPLPGLAAVLLAAAWVSAVVAKTGATGIPPSIEAIAAMEARGPQQARSPGQQQPATAQQPPGGPQPPAVPADYVGTDTCLECHEEEGKSYSGTMHGRAEHPRAPAADRGCESCHGPGSQHVDDPEVPGTIKAFLKEPPKDANDGCLTCHDRGPHAMWEGSAHESRNVACVSCHSVHDFKSERAQLRTVREMDVCASCHRDKVAKVDRSGHMPLREGKMECSTCHNPHGTTNVRLLRLGESLAEACTSCHADKRGPYLWEHAPTRDGCATCHDPHGSSNERMLITKPPILCQRCHIATRHPSTIYDGALIGSGASPSLRIYARSCVTCHSTVHGSNHPSGQRFIR